MSTTNQIGLDQKLSKELIKNLNHLLSNYHIFYSNVRGFHWNIKGKQFFELHLKFEEIYTDALLKIDEIAERILTLGGTPLHTFEDYIAESKIKSSKTITDGEKALALVLEGLQQFLKIERHILELATTANDEGTNALMSDYIREQEKSIWMYKAYLST